MVFDPRCEGSRTSPLMFPGFGAVIADERLRLKQEYFESDDRAGVWRETRLPSASSWTPRMPDHGSGSFELGGDGLGADTEGTSQAA